MRQSVTKYLPGIILFVLSLLVCLFTVKDRGIAWDEPAQRDIGYFSYNYIFKNDNTLLSSISREHGVAFEMPLIFIERVCKLTDARDIYLMRHLVTHLFFLISVFFGYVLAVRLFENQFIACIGFVMLLCMPRIYGQSYVNTKDIPFLAMFLICLSLSYSAFKDKKSSLFLILGFACGYATSIRILGIVLPGMIGGCLLIDLIHTLIQKQSPKKIIFFMCAFALGYAGILYSTWPILWRAPIHTLVEMFHRLSHFTQWAGYVLFRGQYEHVVHLPKRYLLVWMGITIPALWLLAGIAGIGLLLVKMLRNPVAYITNTPQRNFSLYLFSVIFPLASIILLHSIVYDDWRHVYFVYPPFIFLALFFLNELYKRYKVAVQVALGLQMISVLFFMVKYHPYQLVYFNEVVSRGDEQLRHEYELDYWGVAYKQGLEYILKADTSALIKLSSENPDYAILAANNILTLPEQQRKRLVIVSKGEKADYFLSNFRWHPDDYPYQRFHEIKVLNSTILCVYKLN